MPPKPAVAVAAKSVCVIIPARNEEAVIGAAVSSLLEQNHPGPLHIIVVDDQVPIGRPQWPLRTA